MNTCDTCKWFGKTYDYYTREEVPDRFCCNNPKLDDYDMQSGAFIMHQCDSWLKVGPKFGCIHHEPK